MPLLVFRLWKTNKEIPDIKELTILWKLPKDLHGSGSTFFEATVTIRPRGVEKCTRGRVLSYQNAHHSKPRAPTLNRSTGHNTENPTDHVLSPLPNQVKSNNMKCFSQLLGCPIYRHNGIPVIVYTSRSVSRTQSKSRTLAKQYQIKSLDLKGNHLTYSHANTNRRLKFVLQQCEYMQGFPPPHSKEQTLTQLFSEI